MAQSKKIIICVQCGAANRVPLGVSLSKGKCGKCKIPLGDLSPVDISGETFVKLQKRDQGSYVLDVWAPWCGPCVHMAPAYAAAAKRLGGDVRFLKLNSESYPNAGRTLNIRGIPALFIFDNGKMVSQKSGALPEFEILNWVKNALSV